MPKSHSDQRSQCKKVRDSKPDPVYQSDHGAASLLHHESLQKLIEALQTAVWDMKKQSDVRLDDGNYNIDSLDAFEYSVEKYIPQIIRSGQIGG